MAKSYPFLIDSQTANSYKVTSYPAILQSNPGLSYRQTQYYFPGYPPSTSERTHLLIDSPEQKAFVEPLVRIENIEKEKPKTHLILPPSGQESLLMDGRGIAPIENPAETEESVTPSIDNPAQEAASSVSGDSLDLGQESVSDEESGRITLTPKRVSSEEFTKLIKDAKNK